VVTDPPYGLAFMGKRWDYDVPSVAIWAECLRVLKPGGHLLAFAGTRTQHRMAVRIEDAGFEIRDMIAWVYGSGFPKSLDVSKAIDQMDASEEQGRRRLRFTAWVRATGATSRQIDEATGTNMGGHYTTAASQPAIMTREHLEQCRHLLGNVPEWVEREADIRSVESKNFAEREVVGQVIGVNTAKARIGTPGRKNERHQYAVSAPATPEAQQWAGWGTALKPALEPITMARKPLTGTVAANVLEHGTGALNVDGCRVEGAIGGAYTTHGNGDVGSGGVYGGGYRGEWTNANPHPESVRHHASGRWPANLIHDGSDEAVGLFPQAGGGFGKRGGREGATVGDYGMGATMETVGYGDTGSAARFFYCPKVSRKERGEGNTHPTVKPSALMAYLCRLVTPPGGVILDPFMGSGSTGLGALSEGFDFIGVAFDPDYHAIARQRIAEGGWEP
jgi:hypothetical protein